MSFRNIFRSMLALFACSFAFSGCNASEKSPNSPATVDAASIIKSIKKNKPVVVEGQHITGVLDLTQAGSGALATPDAMTYLDCELIFVRCTFENAVLGYKLIDGKQMISCAFSRDVVMTECVFMDKVDLTRCSFSGRLDMTKSDFRAPVSFVGAHLRGGVRLNHAIFEDDADFGNTYISSVASLVRTDFRKDANFQRLRIECDAAFFDSRYGTVADFSNCYVSGQVNLSNARFAGRVECIGAYVAGSVTLSNVSVASNVICEDNIILGEVVLNDAQFDKAPLAARNRTLVPVQLPSPKVGTGIAIPTM